MSVHVVRLQQKGTPHLLPRHEFFPSKISSCTAEIRTAFQASCTKLTSGGARFKNREAAARWSGRRYRASRLGRSSGCRRSGAPGSPSARGPFPRRHGTAEPSPPAHPRVPSPHRLRPAPPPPGASSGQRAAGGGPFSSFVPEQPSAQPAQNPPGRPYPTNTPLTGSARSDGSALPHGAREASENGSPGTWGDPDSTEPPRPPGSCQHPRPQEPARPRGPEKSSEEKEARAPRTHRRRRLPRPPAAQQQQQQQQHHAAHGRAAAPPPPLHPPTRSGAPGAALRRGHTRRGSAAPAGVSRRPPRRQRPPLCRARPLLPAQVLPGLLCPRNIHPHPAAGAWRACAGRAGCRLSRKGRASPPQPFPPGRRAFGGCEGARPPLPAPHLHAAGTASGPRTIFCGGGGAGCRGWRCSRGGGAHLRRGGALVPCRYPARPGPAFPSPQVRRLRSDRTNFLRACGRWSRRRGAAEPHRSVTAAVLPFHRAAPRTPAARGMGPAPGRAGWVLRRGSHPPRPPPAPLDAALSFCLPAGRCCCCCRCCCCACAPSRRAR